jgi:C4-dicarboxylate-specific signal transduction histidine kinase
MGELYNKVGRFEEAIKVLEPILDISRKNINDKRLAGIHTSLAISYLGLKNPKQAQILAQEAVQIADALSAKDYLADALEVLALAYEKDNNFEAANQTLKKQAQVRSEMFKEANNEQINLIKSEYELQQKQSELDRANEEKSLQQKIFVAAGVVLLIMLFFIAQLVKTRKKQRLMYAQLKTSTAQIEEKNKALEASTQEVEHKNREIQAQNEELQASEEELKQNLDKLLILQNNLEVKNQALEETLNELQSTQSQLIQSEKMATLGQLVANIAHEINTPLAAIRSSAQTAEISITEVLPELASLLASISEKDLAHFQKAIDVALGQKQNLSTKEKRLIKYDLIDTLETMQIAQAEDIADSLTEIGLHNHKAIYEGLLRTHSPWQTVQTLSKIVSIFKSNQNIRMATERASKIIFALKNFSRQNQTGGMQEASIIESIETTLTLYHNQIKQGNIEVVRHLAPLPLYACYIDELSQVWTNLIHNAIQAMENQGELQIATSAHEEHLLIRISDNGSGIPEEIQNRIFDPFFTTKKAGEGSGLGLDIVKKIIDKHNGKIWFETEQGIGTSFFVSLPFTHTH